MTKKVLLLTLALICISPVNIIALKLFVYHSTAPMDGMSLSKGVAVVRETGSINNLSSDGFCQIDVPPYIEQITVDVYVPGFQPVGGVFDSKATVELPLHLQSFLGKEIIFTLKECDSKLLAAKAVFDYTVKEAAETPPPEALNPSASLNPFVIIELLVGKSMSEILEKFPGSKRSGGSDR